MNAVPATALCDYDFLQCKRCGRICTKPEVDRALGPLGTGQVCKCGSIKYSPINLPWWGVFLPRVWSFAVNRLVDGRRGWRVTKVLCRQCGNRWPQYYNVHDSSVVESCPNCKSGHTVFDGDTYWADDPGRLS